MAIVQKSQLKEIETSIREMKDCLHFWDSLNNDIDAELVQIDTKNPEELIQARDRLRKLTQQEISDNTDNAEKGLWGLYGVAVIGLGAGLAAFEASGAGPMAAFLLGGSRYIGQGAKFAIRYVKETPKFLKTVGEITGKGFSRIREKWYLRWAPVPLGIGYGVAKTVKTGWELEEKREAKATPVPETVLKSVQQDPVSLDTGMEWAQEYNHNSEMMEYLLPKLYNQVVTPEGALLLTHHLLESFSLSESLSMEKKVVYVSILEREFDRALNHFGQWVLTLGLTGAKESEEALFQSGETVIRGYLVQPGIDDLMDEMRKEKEALQKMMHSHQNQMWLAGHPDAAAAKINYPHRLEMLDRGIPLTWGGTQRKLDDLPFYLDTVKQSFSGMVADFQIKNPALWQSFAEHAGNWIGSKGGTLGYFGSSLFLKGGWSVMFKGIPFMIAGSLFEASYKAEEAASSRLPVQLCIPSYGTLCENL
ncbi:MAG: hypothetical protein Q8P84_06830 [Deltaproteobacteria bacterium]|nr:hypothetical protein [Deltaproteobacteria bacterium]